MTQRQIKTIQSLRKALNRCAAAGLRGGVYDSSFCIWPVAGPEPRGGYDVASNRNFFENVHKCGEVMDGVMMQLDGGAGV